MPINVICPNAGCQKRFTVPDNAAGKSATCTNCGTKIAIPSGDDDLDEPAPKKRPKSDFDLDDGDDEPRSRKKGRKDRDDDDFDDAPPRRRRASSGGGGGGENAFVDFLMFRRMITPWIVIIFYWLSVVLYIIGGLIAFVSPGGMIGIIYGLALMFLGPFVSRIFAETIILAFRINETLTDIRNNTKKE